MDEIFDRIKAIKIKRKYLIANLIAVEILGILVFIWILRTPLYGKFLTIKPKAYSLLQMDKQKRYLVTQGDFVTGQMNPDNKLVLLIWENSQVEQKARIKPEFTGKWSYQFSPDLNPGVKIITIGELDENNNVWSINNYRIRIRSRNLLSLNNTEKSSGLLDNILTTQEEVLKTASDITLKDIYIPSFTLGPLSPPKEE